MNWLMYSVLAVAAAIVFLAWVFVRIRNRAADAVAALRAVQEQEIPLLAAECIPVPRP